MGAGGGPPPVAGGFVGRVDELARVRTRLERAQSGEPQVVLVTGPAGVGKTSIVRHAAAATPGAVVLDAAGDEAEQELAFGAVDQLARAAGAAVPGLDVAGLLLPELRGAVEPSAVGARLLDLVGRIEDAAPDGPVTLVLDDAPWIDVSSLQALSFVLRRLRGDRVAVLATARPEGVDHVPPGLLALLDGERGERVDLIGMGRDDLAALAASLGRAVDGEALARLHAHTEGNPLYAAALLRELEPTDLNEGSAPLPAPRSYSSLVLARLAGCAPATEELVVAAAVLGLHAPADQVLALAAVDDPVAALDEAVAAGLVAVRGEGSGRTVGFTHPLVRAAVYHDLAPGRLAERHRAAADVVGDRWSALRHRAAATLGPSPELARELEQLAADELRRGQPGASTAAAAYRAASTLVPDRQRREELVLRAVEASVSARDLAAVLAGAGEIGSFADTARRRYTEGMLVVVAGDLAGGAVALEAARDLAGVEGDDDILADVHSHLALCRLMLGEFDEAIAAASAVPDLAGGLRGLTPGARPTLAYGLAAVGRYDEARATATGRLPGEADVDPERMLPVGVVDLWLDDLDRSVAQLAATVREADRSGSTVTACLARAWLAQAEYRRGDWDDALAHVGLAASVCEDADFRWIAGQVHGPAALVNAARGAFDEAERHIAAVAAAGPVVGVNALLADSGEMLVAAGQGDWERVDALASRLGATPIGAGVEPGYVDWMVLATEASLALGRPDEAEARLAPFAARVARLGHPTGAVQVARLRAAVALARGDEEAAAGHLDLADGCRAACPNPAEVAKVDLARGAMLRRAGRRRLAAEHLERARATFARLGARPLLERVEREIATAGLAPRARTDDLRDRLTPSEQAVVTLVVRGLRTREVAAELVVSPKTVEYHLGNVYRKLGVTNRSQLAAAVAGPAPAPGT